MKKGGTRSERRLFYTEFKKEDGKTVLIWWTWWT